MKSRWPAPVGQQQDQTSRAMKVLVIDVGGTHVKLLATGQRKKREFDSGPGMTPRHLVSGVRQLTADWPFEAISMGYPGPVLHNRPLAEPHNLRAGWVGFDFARAFKCPIRIVNDAAMQAMGSYEGGRMLFLGLGTGLGSALIVDGRLEPMELGHLPYRKKTFEDYAGLRGLKKLGKRKWRKAVNDVLTQLIAAVEPDETVVGGGNAALIKHLPAHCRLGDNNMAFKGGFRLWADASASAQPLQRGVARHK
jgi:polyphosphate glucokinase